MYSSISHLGVKGCVSVISILQFVSYKLLGAVQSLVRTPNLFQSSLNRVQNLLTGDGDKAQVRLVANYILSKLEIQTHLRVSWGRIHADMYSLSEKLHFYKNLSVNGKHDHDKAGR